MSEMRTRRTLRVGGPAEGFGEDIVVWVGCVGIVEVVVRLVELCKLLELACIDIVGNTGGVDFDARYNHFGMKAVVII